jgi:HlyD family secretion protein
MAHNFKTILPTKSDTNNKKSAVVWVLDDMGISQKEIETGTSDGINVQVVSGLIEGEELVYNLKALTKTEVQSEEASNDSPFMPKPPGKKK